MRNSFQVLCEWALVPPELGHGSSFRSGLAVGHQTLRLSAGQGCARLRQCTGQVADQLNAARKPDEAPRDGLGCIIKMRNDVMHSPARSGRSARYQWSEAHSLAGHFLDLTLLGYRRRYQPRITANCRLGYTEDVPWTGLLKSIGRAHHPHLKGNPGAHSPVQTRALPARITKRVGRCCPARLRLAHGLSRRTRTTTVDRRIPFRPITQMPSTMVV
jgi:hypothetical protein